MVYPMERIYEIQIRGIPVKVERKSIKHLYLRVRADGSVSVSAPLRVSKKRIEQFVEEKLEWILKQRNTRTASPSPSESPKDYRRKMENYQRILTEKLSVLIPKWEAATGLHTTQWKLRDMKTRWGSCTPSSGRIRLNLQLAAYPTFCLEYVIVHELVHLKIPGHPKKFWETVGYYFPEYKKARDLLRQGVPYSSPGN